MATEFYVEQADRSPLSGVANVDIYAGELVHDDGSGVDPYTYSDSQEHAGLARYDAYAFAREHEDEVREQKYVSGNAQRERVQYQPFEDGAIVKVRTIEDNTTDPAPSIGHRDVVGVVDDTAVAGSASEYQGRIVEEGYADSAPTTFNRSSSNFEAVGVAIRPGKQANESVTSYDTPVRLVMFDQPVR